MLMSIELKSSPDLLSGRLVVHDLPDIMKEIVTGLYLASLKDIHDHETLSEMKVSHILTVDSAVLPAQLQDDLRNDGITVDHVFMLDTLDFSITKPLEMALTILENRSPSAVSVVHCFAGVSRSATVIIGFLMKQHDISYDEAFRIVKAKKSDICPNPSFERQLRIFERNGKSFEKFSQSNNFSLRWNLHCQGGKNMKNGLGTVVTAKCRKCRYKIVEACLVVHGDSNSDLCSSLFLEGPQPWMLPDGNCIHDSKISCPSCRSKLGSIKWSGNMCSCKKWITPAIQLHKLKVDKQA